LFPVCLSGLYRIPGGVDESPHRFPVVCLCPYP
jgi:hypothetical protein